MYTSLKIKSVVGTTFGGDLDRLFFLFQKKREKRRDLDRLIIQLFQVGRKTRRTTIWS